jgi:arsenite-transporting ATPase
MPAPPPSLRGPTARWLRERHAEQQAVLAEVRAECAGTVPVETVAYAATEPTGVPALLELAAALYPPGVDPVARPGRDAPPALTVRRIAGEGTSRDSEFELVLRLPGAADGPLDLSRVGDELVVSVGVTRRLVSLPSVLRRCAVTAARLEGEGHATDLVVVFAPDPAVWMR